MNVGNKERFSYGCGALWLAPESKSTLKWSINSPAWVFG